MNRSVLKKIFQALRLLIGLYVLLACMYYFKVVVKIPTNHAVVLLSLSGKKEVFFSSYVPLHPKSKQPAVTKEVVAEPAATTVGFPAYAGYPTDAMERSQASIIFRLPFLTEILSDTPLTGRSIYLNGAPEPMRLIAADKVPIRLSAVMTYSITDPQTWFIKLQNSESLLQSDFDGLVRDYLQAKNGTELLTARETLKNEIYDRLKTKPINHLVDPEDSSTVVSLESKFGIQIVSFTLRETSYDSEQVILATQEATKIREMYTTYREELKDFLSAINADKDPTTKIAVLEFLASQKWAESYMNSKTEKTFVVPGPQMKALSLGISADRPVE